MSVNLGMLLAHSATERPEHTALRLGERALTYTEVDRAARSIATALGDLGLEAGDHVALMIPNLPEFTMSYYGILYAGGCVVPLNILLTAPEVTYHLKDSEAKLLIAHADFAAPARAGAEALGVPVIWVGQTEGTRFETLLDAEPLGTPCARDENDGAVLLYTSGTTGQAKGAELTHSNLLLNAAVVLPRLLPIGRDDSALATLPLFHSFGQTCIQNAFLGLGASITLLTRFTPDAACEAIQRDRLTTFAGVPTMYFALLNAPDADGYDLSSLRYCMAGGAALPVEVLKAFETRYDVQIQEGYGLSETSPVASFNVLHRPRKVGSIGYPVWGVEMCIMDDQDQPVADGERGEICIRGHNVMKGYWKRPEATKEAIRNGWFHSGDIGIRDPDGSYRIVDRKKDMILRGGFNVYPREIEEVLYGHPAIVEAAVVGVPHESHGEEVKAVVVLGAGQELDADGLIAYCRERVAAYKYPRLVEFRESLPKGPTGKILKREL